MWSLQEQPGRYVRLLLLLALSVLPRVTRGQPQFPQPPQDPFSPALFYDPLRYPTECGNYEGQPSLICDPQRVLPRHEFDQLQAILASIRSRNYCPCQGAYACTSSYTIAVAIVPNWQRPPGVDPEEAVQALGEALLSRGWAGHGTCGENAVLVYAPLQRMMYTAVGNEARDRLEDRCRAVLEDRAREMLNRNQQYEALQTVLTEYRDYLSGAQSCEVPLEATSKEGLVITLIVLGIIILLGLTICFIVLFRRHYGKTTPQRSKKSTVGVTGSAPQRSTLGVTNPSIAAPLAGRTELGQQQSQNVFDVPYGRSFGGGAVDIGGLRGTGATSTGLTPAPNGVFGSSGGGAAFDINTTGSQGYAGSQGYGPLPSAGGGSASPASLVTARVVPTPTPNTPYPGFFGGQAVEDQDPRFRDAYLTVGGGDGGGALGFDGF